MINEENFEKLNSELMKAEVELLNMNEELNTLMVEKKTIEEKVMKSVLDDKNFSNDAKRKIEKNIRLKSHDYYNKCLEQEGKLSYDIKVKNIEHSGISRSFSFMKALCYKEGGK